MKRRSFLSSLSFFLASPLFRFKSLVSANPVRTVSLPQENIVPMVPNDPAVPKMGDWVDYAGISKGFGMQNWLEDHTPSSSLGTAVVLVLDTGISTKYASHPDLVGAWLPQYAKNFANGPYDEIESGTTHAVGIISAILAKANNGISAVGPAGYMNRVFFILDRIVENGFTNSTKMRLGYQHAIELKRSGVNVIAVVLGSGGSGDVDVSASLSLIRQMADLDIALFAPVPGGSVNLDTAAIKDYPVEYSTTEPNVLAVASHDDTGTKLTLNTSYGEKRVAVAGLGLNFQTIDDPDSKVSTASFSSTAAATGQAAGMAAIAWIYRSRNMAKALHRLKKGAVGPISGTQFGRINLAGALAEYPVTLVTVNGRLLGMDSVTQKVEPFSSESMFAKDGRTRLTFMLENVDLPLAATDIVVTLEDRDRRSVTLKPEAVREVPRSEWLTQVVIRLPSLPEELTPGDITVTVTARGNASSAKVNLQ